MFENYTEEALHAIELAKNEARRLGHGFVGTEQLLVGIVGEDTGVGAKTLKSVGVNLKDACVQVEKIIGRGTGYVPSEFPFTPRAMMVLELAQDEARILGDKFVDTEHLLLGIIREGEGVAARILENLDVDLSKMRGYVMHVRELIRPL